MTTRVVEAEDYWGGKSRLFKRVLDALPVETTILFIHEIGIDLKAEENGELFPTTNKARSVLEALLAETNRCGVILRPAHRVTSIERCDDGFRIETSAGALCARPVVLAAGGKSLPKTGSDGAGYRFAQGLGHTLVPMTPALVPLVLADDFHVQLSGIAQDVELTVHAENAKPIRVGGSLLWTHFGVSGPAVLDASRYWHRARLEGREVRVTVNFLPGRDFTETERYFLDLTLTKPKSLVRNGLSRLLPGRVAEAVLRTLAIDVATSMAHLRKDHRRKLVHGLLAWPLTVHDSRGYAYAVVTAGGVAGSEIDPGSMASRQCSGLCLVGGILDVGGRIAGFNFQWAWSSAWVAGMGVTGQSKR